MWVEYKAPTHQSPEKDKDSEAFRLVPINISETPFPTTTDRWLTNVVSAFGGAPVVVVISDGSKIIITVKVAKSTSGVSL